jgi:hypothetical protein
MLEPETPDRAEQPGNTALEGSIKHGAASIASRQPRSNGIEYPRQQCAEIEASVGTVAENQRKQQRQLDMVDIATQDNNFTNNPVGEDLPVQALDESDDLKRVMEVGKRQGRHPTGRPERDSDVAQTFDRLPS